MKVSTILQNVGIDPDEPVLSISAEEAINNILEAIEEYCPNIEIDKMSKKELLSLILCYGNCVVNYHPEDYHQERAALLKNFEMLKKFGLTNEDYNTLDFC